MGKNWMLVGALAVGLVGALTTSATAGAHGNDGSDAGTGPRGASEDVSSPGRGRDSGRNNRVSARLSGLNEIGSDGKSGAGELKGTGRATVTVRNGNEVCWSISADGIGPATLAHIHKGAIGSNGAVVVDFDATFKGCKTVDAALAGAIVAGPEDYYVNVHTADFKGGAVRGQLRDEVREVTLRARLSGAEEVGAAGDPDGKGRVEVGLRGTLICWNFTATGLDAVVAQHIHKAPAGSGGPVVVDFDGNARGCRDITEALAADIVANPANYYGNMHTTAFTAGAIRGQLARGQVGRRH